MDREFVNSQYMIAAKEALKCFPIQAENIKFVHVSENMTFKVKVVGSETDYSLRLHRPGYNTLDELESERMWTNALSSAGVIVPEGVCSSLNQKYYVLIDIPGIGEQRYAGLTSWVQGVPLEDHLDSCESDTEKMKQFHRLGEIIATMHNQTAAWRAPSHFKRRRLDIDALLGEEPFWGRFWEHPDLTKEEQDLLLRTRDDLRASLKAYGENSNNFGLTHADFNMGNLIYTGDDLAVIDFDDSAYGWHMYDIAAALNDLIGESGIEEARGAILAGYQEHRQLETRDIEMIPDFQLIRGMALIGWYHERPEHSGQDYFTLVKDWVVAECNARDV